MSNIEKLYYNMDKLSDNFVNSKETEQKYEAIENALGKENVMRYESEIIGYAAASEKQGFIMGFQYAVSLLTERNETQV